MLIMPVTCSKPITSRLHNRQCLLYHPPILQKALHRNTSIFATASNQRNGCHLLVHSYRLQYPPAQKYIDKSSLRRRRSMGVLGCRCDVKEGMTYSHSLTTDRQRPVFNRSFCNRPECVLGGGYQP